MNLPVFGRRDVKALVASAETRVLPLRATSWVSALIASWAVERHGLPTKAFFYQADDIDYTARILRHERGFLVCDSVVEHRTGTPRDPRADGDPGRFYFHARNNLWMLRGPAWAPSERPAVLLFLVVTSWRFLQVNGFSRESAGTLARALRDGLRRPPASPPPARATASPGP
jgi:GT2 family glycosyltransferase